MAGVLWYILRIVQYAFELLTFVFQVGEPTTYSLKRVSEGVAAVLELHGKGPVNNRVSPTWMLWIFQHKSSLFLAHT